MEYVKLSLITAEIAAGDLTRAAVLASITAGTLKVVNLKGRILTTTEFGSHLDGSINGEAVAAFTGTDAQR